MLPTSKAILIVAAFGSLAPAANSSTSDIDFREIQLGDADLPPGYHVFRDSASWEEGFVPYWPEMYHEVDGEYELVQPPRPDFSESLIIALSYGLTGCYEMGGEIESIAHDGDSVVVSLTHVYQVMPACLAAVPRVLYYRIRKSDIQDDVGVVFREASLPYDLDPRQWYPLSIGNAWHFRTSEHEWIEVVDETQTVEGSTWYVVRLAYCSEDPCPISAERHLRWTDDHYLLSLETASTPPGSSPDTLHATAPRSLFTVNIPYDTTLAYGVNPVEARIWMHDESPLPPNLLLYAAIDNEGIARYLYGFGPADWLYAAVVDGERRGDTSLIATVLTTSLARRPPPEEARIDVIPHPANQAALITFVPARSGTARMVIFDVLGRSVAQVSSTVTAETPWRIPLSSVGVAMAPGLYFVRTIDDRGRSAEMSMIVIE